MITFLIKDPSSYSFDEFQKKHMNLTIYFYIYIKIISLNLIPAISAKKKTLNRFGVISLMLINMVEMKKILLIVV